VIFIHKINGNRSDSLLKFTISALKNEHLYLTVLAHPCATRHLNILFGINSHFSPWADKFQKGS